MKKRNNYPKTATKMEVMCVDENIFPLQKRLIVTKDDAGAWHAKYLGKSYHIMNSQLRDAAIFRIDEILEEEQ